MREDRACILARPSNITGSFCGVISTAAAPARNIFSAGASRPVECADGASTTANNTVIQARIFDTVSSRYSEIQAITASSTARTEINLDCLRCAAIVRNSSLPGSALRYWRAIPNRRRPAALLNGLLAGPSVTAARPSLPGSSSNAASEFPTFSGSKRQRCAGSNSGSVHNACNCAAPMLFL